MNIRSSIMKFAKTKAADIGAFLISPEAETALQRFRKGPEEKSDPQDWYSTLKMSILEQADV